MRVVVQEERPGELTEAAPSELLARLDEAFMAAREAVAKSHGVEWGKVDALHELVQLSADRYRDRLRRLKADVRAALGDEG